MSKLSGSYESVVRGVSEQAPQSRRSGQHFAQVNMISDPVRGLARRHGSILQDEVVQATSADQWAALLADTAGHKTVPFFIAGSEYDLIIRTTASTLGSTGFCWAFSKATRQFIPVVYSSPDANLGVLMSGGVSAAVNVGRYVYLAGNTLVPAVTNNNLFEATDNARRAVAWVRGGAYSRTFTVTVTKADNTKVVGSYKTKSSSYPGTLDTSDIPLYTGGVLNEEYQKQINDRVNEYNSNVTKWIGEAAEDITPENIAQKLVDALVLLGIAATRQAGHVIITEPAAIEVSVDDGGDGSLLIGVGNDVDNIDRVSVIHYVGKIIRVVPDDPTANAVYLKATAKDGVSTGYTEVIWRESAGFLMTPTVALCMATVEDGTLYMSSTAAGLSALIGTAVPNYKANSVGDDLSSPLPEFFGRGISYLGVFQDRLVVGSGATLLFSRPGDYLNWFRKSVTTVNDDDPWEGFALGSEDDTIKWSTTYDRNLLLYGRRFQYSVSGRQPLTPKTASIIVVSSFEDAVDAAPEATGNYVIYSKYSGRPGKEVSSVHQVQAGVVADSPESYKISQQLDTYLQGIPHELVTLTAPNLILLRTKKERQRIFTYSYLDGGQNERLMDSWSHWEWSSQVGYLIGASKDDGDVILYMIKHGPDASNTDRIWISAERFVRDTALSDYPYLDSLRSLDQFAAGGPDNFLNTAHTDLSNGAVAVEAGNEFQFVGLPLTRWEDFQVEYPDYTSQAWVGILYPSNVTPTNPYAKDRNEMPILSGRLTLSNLNVAVSDTGALQASTVIRGTTRPVLNFIGRLLGAPANLIGRQPIVSTSLSVIVGAEVRECSYTLSAVSWLPLTITSIDWTGQFFFNTRRA